MQVNPKCIRFIRGGVGFYPICPSEDFFSIHGMPFASLATIAYIALIECLFRTH